MNKVATDFLVDESGSVSAESVIWSVFYLFFMGLIADVALLFNSQAVAMRIAQDANRMASMGILQSGEDVEALAMDRISVYSPNATVKTAIGNQAVATIIEMPATDLMAVGLVTQFSRLTVKVGSMHKL